MKYYSPIPISRGVLNDFLLHDQLVLEPIITELLERIKKLEQRIEGRGIKNKAQLNRSNDTI
ncbi:MAG: hypothetical protein UX04_C0002G0326 [Microgenomates group bacterium GW2011_GWF2_45_18]|nr:MAG: hypothetical protein UW18_C0003G0236 [Microgenomates group bacterium GW2011_GWF1_44_10]KKU02183.1 MAG: hypothetical protein UX04_C0002G0326 [Microgenomates group bacterium GW2011_GWF2_45_18]OGJ40913.1 MAG: hypothetical protein A2378_03185 [Candidatus Pacebacteria bacterium RIFOXYB1_FULL_44_10]HAU99323.1 hypothetical protein [Candidatus Paceibacterota bacterium]HAX01841.1 hypothetical protein [Candidatus Paceibacterota bacterium]